MIRMAFRLIKIAVALVLVIALIGALASRRGPSGAPSGTPPGGVPVAIAPGSATGSSGTGAPDPIEEDRGSVGSSSPARESPAPPAPIAEEPLPPGTEVEVLAATFYERKGSLREGLSIGGRPPGLRNGRDIFGGTVGTRGVVEETDADAVRVRLLDGSWKGRIGWTSREGIRKRPTPGELAGDVDHGLGQDRRREIFLALHRMGLDATLEADRRYSLSDVPTDGAALKKHLAARKRLYEARKKEGRIALVKKYKVDGATLDRIEEEGDSKRWPVSD